MLYAGVSLAVQEVTSDICDANATMACSRQGTQTLLGMRATGASGPSFMGLCGLYGTWGQKKPPPQDGQCLECGFLQLTYQHCSLQALSLFYSMAPLCYR